MPPFIWDCDLGVVGLDCAEGKVLGGRLHCSEMRSQKLAGKLHQFFSRMRTCMSHIRLNSDDLPTFGKPTIPIFRLLFTRPKRLADFCTGGAAALGGMLHVGLQRERGAFLLTAAPAPVSITEPDKRTQPVVPHPSPSSSRCDHHHLTMMVFIGCFAGEFFRYP